MAFTVLLVFLFQYENTPAVLGRSSLVVLVVGWAGWTKWRHGLQLSALFGRVPRRLSIWGTAALLLFAVTLFGEAEFAMFVPWLETNAPSLADWYQMNAVGDLPSETWAYLARVVPPVLVAPFIEEMFFRGFLYQRWARSWRRPGWALGASALVFTLFHGNIVSTFLFAVITTLLYLEARSLWVPIGFHMAANGIAVLGGLPIERGLSVVGIEAEPVIGLVGLIAAGSILGGFFWWQGPSLHGPLPYTKNVVADRLEPSSQPE